jgi:hypothetical protein
LSLCLRVPADVQRAEQLVGLVGDVDLVVVVAVVVVVVGAEVADVGEADVGEAGVEEVRDVERFMALDYM